MVKRTRIDVYSDGAEYVAFLNGAEFRAGNPFGLDSKISNAGAPVPHDLYFIGPLGDR